MLRGGTWGRGRSEFAKFRGSFSKTSETKIECFLRQMVASNDSLGLLLRLLENCFNSVHTRCIVKTGGFTRGVCKNRGFY